MIGIIGAGAMGAALALHLQRAQRRVSILATSFDGPVLEAAASGDPHPALNVSLEGIELCQHDSWPAALGELDMVVLAVSTAGLLPTVSEVVPHLKDDALIVVATKGWDASTMRPAAQIVSDATAEERVVALVGPSLAGEVASGAPTALVCASRSEDAARRVAEAFASPSLRTYVSTDVAGVEVGAILKNIVAIAIGAAEGSGDEASLNMRSFLFARGLIEMSILAEALGGDPGTILGLTGAGDLFVTALGGRNGRFGRLIGSGVAPKDALEQMNTTVEGVANAATASKLAKELGLDLPLVNTVVRMLEGAAPREALAQLFDGAVSAERA